MRFLCPHCRTILSGDIGAEVECTHCHEKVKFPDSRTAPGSIIGDFAIVSEIARGGVGIVYLARQISLDRPVALKLLQERFTGDKEFVDNFVREARAAARISHPNIVQAYAVGEEDGIYYFAMEHLDGDTMKQVLKRDKIVPPRRAAEIISEIAQALDCAWNEQKLVHQDIKPDNIMLTHRGQAKLADLGLARVATEAHEENEADEVMGTPQYISPEQLTGAPTDVRSDIYSLGATFFHLVTGRFPYLGKDGNEIARQHVEGTLTEPKTLVKDLPDEINRIILKMMNKDINQRYQSAADVAADLKKFLAGNAENAKPKIVLVPKGSGNSGLKLGQSRNEGPKLGESREEGPKLGESREEGPKLGESRENGPHLTASTPASAAMPAVVPAPAESKPTLMPPRGGAKPSFGVKAAKPAPTPAPAAAPETTPAAATGASQSGVTPPKQRGGLTKKAADALPPPAPLPAEEKMARELAQKPERDWTPLKKFLKVVAVLVILIVLLGGGSYALLRSGKLPEKYLPHANKVLALIKLQVSKDGTISSLKGNVAPATETASQTAGTPGAPPAVEEPAKPVEPPKPVTRPEFLAGIEKCLAQLRANPTGENEFLGVADEFFATYPAGAVTDEERAALQQLVNLYGRIDERCRMAPMRRKARQEREAAIARRQSESEQQQAEAAAQLAAQQKTADDARRAVQATAAEAAEQARALRAELMVRANAYFARIKPERLAMLAEFPAAVASEDPATWLELQKKLVAEKQKIPVNALPEERSAAEEISQLAQALGKDFEQTRAIREILTTPDKISQVTLELSRRRLVRAARLEGPILVTRTSGGQEIKLDLNNEMVFSRFAERLGRKFKIQNTPFYLALASEQYQFCGKAPDAAVAKALPEMLNAVFAERWKQADEQGRDALRKRYGAMPEFRRAIGE